MSPERSDYVITLAACLQSFGLFNEAAALVGAVVPEDREDPRMKRIQAELALGRGDATKALELLESMAQRLSKVDGDTAGSWAILGVCHAKMRHWGQARGISKGSGSRPRLCARLRGNGPVFVAIAPKRRIRRRGAQCGRIGTSLGSRPFHVGSRAVADEGLLPRYRRRYDGVTLFTASRRRQSSDRIRVRSVGRRGKISILSRSRQPNCRRTRGGSKTV